LFLIVSISRVLGSEAECSLKRLTCGLQYDLYDKRDIGSCYKLSYVITGAAALIEGSSLVAMQ